MKTILSTLLVLGAFAGTANAKFDQFNDPRQALPRAEIVDPFTDPSLPLPRSERVDPFTDPSLPLPLTDSTFPDIVIATP